MTTEVIILAQGNQSRLGMQHGYKQLLPLPSCGGVGIMHRTLCQLSRLNSRLNPAVSVTLVTWGEVSAPLIQSAFRFGVEAVELADPGNSSLKGIARYLEQTRATFKGRTPAGAGSPHHTIVLLGDVVYSWACLETIMALASAYGFCGTSDLSEGGGEVWGMAWARPHEDAVLSDLRDALLLHPPFEDTYQPGQLRRWVKGWHKGALQDRIRRLRYAGVWRDIDDYTMDVDLPKHIPMLEAASHAAAADDLAHGLVWTGERG